MGHSRMSKLRGRSSFFRDRLEELHCLRSCILYAINTFGHSLSALYALVNNVGKVALLVFKISYLFEVLAQ